MDDVNATNMLNDPIPLPKVNGKTLSKLLQWCEYHKEDPIPTEKEMEENKIKTDNIPCWDEDFLNMDLNMLFEVILAANYLDIRGLLDVSSKTVANMIKGKTPEQIRQTFDIQNDFTPDEEEQVSIFLRQKNLYDNIFDNEFWSTKTNNKLFLNISNFFNFGFKVLLVPVISAFGQ